MKCPHCHREQADCPSKGGYFQCKYPDALDSEDALMHPCPLVNLHDFNGMKEEIVYIGRRHPKWGSSLFQNPYKIGRDGNREEVIQKYRDYLDNSPFLLRALLVLRENLERGQKLGCWCVPKACHGHVLLEALGYSASSEIEME